MLENIYNIKTVLNSTICYCSSFISCNNETEVIVENQLLLLFRYGKLSYTVGKIYVKMHVNNRMFAYYHQTSDFPHH